MSDETGLVLDSLKLPIAEPHGHHYSKVTVVGVGQVGMACAYTMLVQHVASELCLVDVVADKLQGEMMDLQHGLSFIKNCTIKAGTDYSLSAGSKICVVTAGARQRDGESRLSLVQRNVEIMKGIIPNLVKYSPNTILLIVSNPVDILTYVAWKLSGLPKERVIVAVWSGANVAGVDLSKLNPKIGQEDDPERWKDLHTDVVNSAYQIIKLKGYTSWAIGLSVSHICHCILRDARQVMAVSVDVEGVHGINHEVYLSLPSVVGSAGVTDIIKQKLTAAELQQLQKSANSLYEIQNSLNI